MPFIKNLRSANGTGREAELEALKEILASAIDAPDTPARDLAALSRQYIQVSALLEAETPEQTQSFLTLIMGDGQEKTG